MSQGIKVLSYNVWGVPVAKHIKERMEQLGPKLCEYDVVCLQEQFMEEDFDLLMSKVPAGMFNVRRFPSSFVGSGLTIMSKFEITSAHFELFPAQGRPESILQGDYMAQKGVALARLRLTLDGCGETGMNHHSPTSPVGGSKALGGTSTNPNDRLDDSNVVDLLVYNTHLIAQYERYSQIGGYDNESNAAARLSQALAMAKFVVHTARPKDFIVVCGDFNCTPDSPEMKLFLSVCHGHGINLHRALVNDGGRTNTTFSDENKFNGPGSFLNVLSLDEDRPAQLDHILVSTRTMMLIPFGPSPTVSPRCHQLAATEPVGVVTFTSNDMCDLRTKKNQNAGCCPFSDHFGVGAKLVPFHPMKPPYFITRESIEPTLLDDYSRTNEVVSFAMKFLKGAKGAELMSWQAKKWLLTSALCLMVPIASFFLNGRAIPNSLNGILGNSSDTPYQFPTVTHHPVVVLVLGIWAGISFIIGFLNRRNDAVTYTYQAGQLKRLLEE